MVSQAFSVVLPKDPFDSGFASLCDAEAIFTRDSNSARQRLLDNLSYQLIDVRTILSQNPSGAGQEAMQKLVRNMQISLQYVIHRLGCYRMEIKDIKKERDELFDELVFLRDSAALSQKKLKQLQQQQHGLNQSVDTSYGGGSRSRSQQQHHQQGSGSSAKKEYKCRICGNVYPIQYALTSHMLKRHSHEAAALSAGGGSVDPMNHTDEWHTSSFPHQRGAALAGGDMTAMYPGGAAGGLPSTTTNSPAPKLPSQGRGGAGLVDPISDSIDHKLEVSQITELKSEISNLKRSLESVTVELRVSQELQRDRESQMREVQEELRRSVSPASLRNSVAAVQQEQQQLSPPSTSSVGVDVMSSAETLVLLRNQGSRLESIERALHTQQQLQAMQQQQQQLHAVDLSNVQQANTPSQASPFSIPNFNAAAKSAIKDGGTGSNGPPSSGRSGKQTSFASGLMMDSTPHAASLATRTSPGKQVPGTASSGPSTPLTKKTSPIPGPMSTTVLGGKTTTTTTASAKEELKANNPSTPTRPTSIAASKTVAASPDDDDEVVVTTAGNSTAATPNSTKKVAKAIEDEKDNSQPDASTEPAVTTWRPPAANKAAKKSMIVPTTTSNTTPVPVKKRPSETNFDSDSESGSMTGTPEVKQASKPNTPVAQEPDRPSTTSPSEVPADNEVSTAAKRTPTPSTPGVPTPVSIPQEETPVSSSPPPPPSSAPADEPPVVSNPMVDPSAAAAALNGGAAAVPQPDSARSNTTTGTSTSSGSSGTSTSSSGGGGDTAAPSAPSTARGENDEAREQQGDEFTANQMAALKQKYAASVSSSSTAAAAAKASTLTPSPGASADPPIGEEPPIAPDQPSGVVPVVTTVAPVTTMVAPATTGVPAVGVLGAPRAKKKPLSLFGGASAGGGAGSGLGTGGIKAHDDDDDDESF